MGVEPHRCIDAPVGVQKDEYACGQEGARKAVTRTMDVWMCDSMRVTPDRFEIVPEESADGSARGRRC
jgi:hypothetical protein